jgi:hypothetical protein
MFTKMQHKHTVGFVKIKQREGILNVTTIVITWRNFMQQRTKCVMFNIKELTLSLFYFIIFQTRYDLIIKDLANCNSKLHSLQYLRTVTIFSSLLSRPAPANQNEIQCRNFSECRKF